jgi:hypothetical protein
MENDREQGSIWHGVTLMKNDRKGVGTGKKPTSRADFGASTTENGAGYSVLACGNSIFLVFWSMLKCMK